MKKTLTVDIKDEIDVEIVYKKLHGDALGLLAAQEWYRLTSPYMPRREGNLMQNVEIRPWRYINVVPYSARLYFNPDFNFRKNVNVKAGGKWDVRAMQEKQDEKLNFTVQEWINKNI